MFVRVHGSDPYKHFAGQTSPLLGGGRTRTNICRPNIRGERSRRRGAVIEEVWTSKCLDVSFCGCLDGRFLRMFVRVRCALRDVCTGPLLGCLYGSASWIRTNSRSGGERIDLPAKQVKPLCGPNIPRAKLSKCLYGPCLFRFCNVCTGRPQNEASRIQGYAWPVSSHSPSKI